MGNRLCKMVERAKAEKKRVEDIDIRRTVSEISAQIGKEALRICANHVASSSLPRFGISEKYGNPEIEPVPSDWVAEKLEEFIRGLGRDVFDYTFLLEKLEEFQPLFQELAEKTKYRQNRLDTILWQHGLLGYRESRDSKRSVFYITAPAPKFELPPYKEEYVLHASMIDLLGIEPVGAIPIGC